MLFEDRLDGGEIPDVLTVKIESAPVILLQEGQVGFAALAREVVDADHRSAELEEMPR
jgi:hypothetical protein